LASGARSNIRLDANQLVHENGRTRDDAQQDNAAVELASATPLFVACARHYVHGNGLDIIRVLLKEHGDPNATNALCSTSLMAAVEHGGGPVLVPGKKLRDVDEGIKDTTNLVTVLLEENADPTRKDRNGWTALLLGSYLGQRDEVRELLEFTTPNFKRHTKSMDLTIAFRSKHGCSPRASSPRHEQLSPIPDPSWVSTIVDDRDENGRSPLMLACQQKKPDVVDVLLKHGADVDAFVPSNGWTALMFCLKSGSIECVPKLLEKKCSLGILPHPKSHDVVLQLGEKDKSRWNSARTAIQQRTKRRHDSRAKRNTSDTTMVRDTELFPRDEITGWTPVMIGCHHCISVQHAHVLRAVIEACGPVNPQIFQVDMIGFPAEVRTPYDVAHVRGNTAAVRLLAEAKTRYHKYQELITGRPALPSVDDRVKVLRRDAADAADADNVDERQEAARADRNRQRRREERSAKKRDEKEESVLLKSRKGKVVVKRVVPMPVKLRRMPVVGGLAPIVGGGGDGRGGLGNGGGGGVAFTTKDYELQLDEAMQEILRLRDVLESTRNEKKHWKDVCRSREEEIAENRQKWQEERKLLVEEARRGRESGGGAMVFKL
jgi:ankyrin repeat protein